MSQSCVIYCFISHSFSHFVLLSSHHTKFCCTVVVDNLWIFLQFFAFWRPVANSRIDWRKSSNVLCWPCLNIFRLSVLKSYNRLCNCSCTCDYLGTFGFFIFRLFRVYCLLFLTILPSTGHVNGSKYEWGTSKLPIPRRTNTTIGRGKTHKKIPFHLYHTFPKELISLCGATSKICLTRSQLIGLK